MNGRRPVLVDHRRLAETEDARRLTQAYKAGYADAQRLGVAAVRNRPVLLALWAMSILATAAIVEAWPRPPRPPVILEVREDPLYPGETRLYPTAPVYVVQLGTGAGYVQTVRLGAEGLEALRRWAVSQ